ncbi:MAG: hypothetical protein M3044_09860 [Thermoproteota archaeon]|nr:hypothetical protein [Thermoproteota archaeon]
MKTNNRKKQWLELKILNLAFRGYTYVEISETMHVSLGKISSILSKINQDAKEEIKGWVDHVTPMEYKKSLLLIQYIIKKSGEIAEKSNDERCVLQALSVMEQTDQAKRSLLSDTHVINMAISRIEKNKIEEVKQRVEENLNEVLAEEEKKATTITTKATKQKKHQAKEMVF